MKIGIFCSANENIDRAYFTKTAELGRWCARQGHSIVFGGCRNGLMGCVAEAFASEPTTRRAELIGVVPRLIEQGGRASELLTVHIPCENLSDRKDLMLAQSDVVVALPGGIGTLDEVFTVVTSLTLGYHHTPVVVYNMQGFWDSLIALMDNLQRCGMIRGQWRDFLHVVTSLSELEELLGRL